jgi:hypothetical protein
LLYNSNNDDIIADDNSDTVELEIQIIIVEINDINTIYKPAEKIRVKLDKARIYFIS